MDIYEKLRAKIGNKLNKLTKDEIFLLSSYLNTQVPMDELTSEDKNFLRTSLEAQCRDCDTVYWVKPIENLYGLCPSCMNSKGLSYGDDPFGGGAKKFLGVAAAIVFFIFILISVFDDSPDYDISYEPSYSSSSSSSSSSSTSVQACINESESKFKSCIYSIPGNASESEMNYCLDLHEARRYKCRN